MKQLGQFHLGCPPLKLEIFLCVRFVAAFHDILEINNMST